MKRWKNLRDRFVRELKKSKKNDSDDGADSLHSSWPFFDFLLFLQDSVRHRKYELYSTQHALDLSTACNRTKPTEVSETSETISEELRYLK
jgi:hypothetical protein